MPRTLGRYRVVDVLGAGVSGVTYLASDDTVQRPVAIKQLSPEAASDLALRERFVREARLLAHADDEHVVRVLDVGESDGLPWMVMEFMERGTLAERLDTVAAGERRMDDEDLARLLAELGACCRALERRELVHRDIKPSNLLIRRRRGTTVVTDRRGTILDPDEQLVVADLGFARRVSSTPGAASIVAGTHDWSAPEQFVGGAVDGRADIYAFSRVVGAVLGLRAATVSVDDHVRASLARVVERGTATDPAVRHPDSVAWRDDIATALEGAAADRGAGRRRVLIAGGLLAVVAVAGVALARGGGGPAIVGPTAARVGEPVAYVLEDAGASVSWSVGGEQQVDDILLLTFATPGTVRLTASWGGADAVTEVNVAAAATGPVIAADPVLVVGQPATFRVEPAGLATWLLDGEPAGEPAGAAAEALTVVPDTAGVLGVVARLDDGTVATRLLLVVDPDQPGAPPR